MFEVFLNGGFVERDAAQVHALDAAVQHGVALFETMLGGVEPGGEEGGGAGNGGGRPWVFRLGDHLERLNSSARDLGLSDSLRTGPLGDAILETVHRAGLPRARVRLTLTGGNLNLLAMRAAGGSGTPDPTILIVPQPATVYPDAMFERGVAVAIADTRTNPLNPFEGHKTISYWWRLQALQAASAAGAAEAIVLQVTNHLAGGCVSNVFLVKDGILRTPIARGEEPGRGLPSPVLPGITRWCIIDLAGAASPAIEVRREMLTVEDLIAADEVFLTNSSWGVLPVVSLIGLGDRRKIGSGAPGPVTRAMREGWLRDVAKEAAEAVS